MTRYIVNKAIKECEEKAKLGYALTKATNDCATCTWADIDNEFGAETNGIWLKYFTWGANKQKFDNNINYIAHFLTEEQKDIVLSVLQKYFLVEWDKSNSKCIIIKNKVEVQNV